MSADPTNCTENNDRDLNGNGDGGQPLCPWERREDEPPKAWQAFKKYRDMGLRRTLDAVARELASETAPDERPPSANRRRRNGTVSDWSRRFNWCQRARLWDAECDRQARLAQVEEIREMSARHVRMARELQCLAIRSLQALSPEDLSSAEVLKWLLEGAKLERLALGEPTERGEQKITGTPLVVEVVERIVPIRGDAQATSAAPDPATVEEAPVTHRLIGVMPDEVEGDAACELPDVLPGHLR